MCILVPLDLLYNSQLGVGNPTPLVFAKNLPTLDLHAENLQLFGFDIVTFSGPGVGRGFIVDSCSP